MSHILIVDDDESILKALRRVLTLTPCPVGGEVRAAAYGPGAGWLLAGVPALTGELDPGHVFLTGHPQVMPGYWNHPEETAKVFTREGWLRTGDLGSMDERGYFRITDRKKDMIVVSGFKVYPNQIEDVVALHPGVKEVAAIGVPDERSGEIVKIIVVRQDATLTEQALLDHCRKHLTGYKVPRIVEFRREPLPKSNLGKILRRQLREAPVPAVEAATP